jgi:bifunctional DNase/RNase
LKKIRCEVLGLSSSPATGGAFALLLKEVDGNRRLPIMIGHFEAQAIGLELEGSKPPRPLTHDLLKIVIDELGGSVTEIIINELYNNTFYAKIIIELATLTNEIDARPSDAIALALRADAPIYVADSVMEAASFSPNDDIVDGSEETAYEEEKQTNAPLSKEAQIATLQEQLKAAIDAEEYERAAKLRDDIAKLSQAN